MSGFIDRVGNRRIIIIRGRYLTSLVENLPTCSDWEIRMLCMCTVFCGRTETRGFLFPCEKRNLRTITDHSGRGNKNYCRNNDNVMVCLLSFCRIYKLRCDDDGSEYVCLY